MSEILYDNNYDFPKPINNNDVDVVFTWVDGSDPNHQRIRNSFLKKPNFHTSSYESCRWRSSGEIRESIHSVLHFAGSWIRNIYVVCSLGQNCFKNNEIIFFEKKFPNHQIIIVQDKDICPITPIFNSHAIEANLHKIPGLAEKFIYMCDDMFFGAPISKSLFFDPKTQKPKIYMGALLSINAVSINTPAWYAARVNNFQLLNKIFGYKSRKDTIHQARAITKSIAELAWSNPILRSRLQKTCSSRFRSSFDVEPIGLFSWVGIETNRCVQIQNAKGAIHVRNKYFQIDDSTNFGSISAELKNKKPQLYCLNDTMVRPAPMHLTRYDQFLRTSLPHYHK